jgi:two-component system nitrogen regulation sensor histidine kinase GlnL
VFWALPLLAFGMEVMALRRTSHQAVHELKNKLISGLSWIGCLKEDLERRSAGLLEDRGIREDLELCESSVREGAALAKTYLQLASIYTPAFAPVNINDVLAAAADAARALAGQFGLPRLEVELELDPRIGARELDGGQLKMAFVNLCKNAVEAMAQAGARTPRLRLESAAENGRARVAIGDNGPGMPREIAENLFVPFRTKKEGGTGLGLTIVKKIVDVHGGTIGVSTGPDGTRFELVV